MQQSNRNRRSSNEERSPAPAVQGRDVVRGNEPATKRRRTGEGLDVDDDAASGSGEGEKESIRSVVGDLSHFSQDASQYQQGNLEPLQPSQPQQSNYALPPMFQQNPQPGMLVPNQSSGAQMYQQNQQSGNFPGLSGQAMPAPQQYPGFMNVPLQQPGGFGVFGMQDPRYSLQQQFISGNRQIAASPLVPHGVNQFQNPQSENATSPNASASQPVDSHLMQSQGASNYSGSQGFASSNEGYQETLEPGLSGRSAVSLYMACDEDSLSEYQCLVRKQIELFEAGRTDVESNAQGRNRAIVMGQVGIRCRHCTFLPPKHRARGAVYYPAKLHGLYQAAQNMASGHLCEHCQHVPAAIRDELQKLRERKSSAGGGKKYWADGVRVLGVYEDEDGLRFEDRRVVN